MNKASDFGISIIMWTSALSFAKILDEIDEHGIKIYHLPDAESDEDEDFKEQTRILKVSFLCFLLLCFFLFFNKVHSVG